MENVQKLILVLSIVAVLLSSASIFGLVFLKNSNTASPIVIGNDKKLSYSMSSGYYIESNNAIPTIRVTGRYTKYVKPDTIEITLGVEEQASNAQEAFNKVSSVMQKIVAKLLEMGIQRDNISTTVISLYPIYNWKDKTSVLVGYRASNMIKIKISDVTLASKVLDTSIELGATKVYGVRFHVSQEQYNSIYLEALKMATKDAKEKAQAIADALEVKITGVLSVSIGEVYIPRDIPLFFESKASMSNTPIMEGKSSISATVTVVFTISNE